MILGLMSWKGPRTLEFIDRIMNKEIYRRLLIKNLEASRLSQDFWWFQTGGPPNNLYGPPVNIFEIYNILLCLSILL